MNIRESILLTLSTARTWQRTGLPDGPDDAICMVQTLASEAGIPLQPGEALDAATEAMALVDDGTEFLIDPNLEASHA